jgi:hypothetical protein
MKDFNVMFTANNTKIKTYLTVKTGKAFRQNKENLLLENRHWRTKVRVPFLKRLLVIFASSRYNLKNFIEQREKIMAKTKEQLLERKAELEKQLNRVNQDERLELDNDLEEQAIQTEQEEVAVTMEENLRKELLQVEDQLLDFEDE